MKKHSFTFRVDLYYTNMIIDMASQKNVSPTDFVRDIVLNHLKATMNPVNEVKDWELVKSELKSHSDLLKSIQEEVIKVKMLDKKFTIGMWAVNSKVHPEVFKELDLNEDPNCLFSNEGIFTK